MHHLLKPSLKTVAPSLLLLALVSLCTQVSSLSPIFSGKDASEIRLFFSFLFLNGRQPSTFPLRREYLVYGVTHVVGEPLRFWSGVSNSFKDSIFLVGRLNTYKYV